ncbi:3-hydroxyacyl-CoA dehydrogenase NAD-binding domain-containing protein [Sphingobacterium thalpophilum]|uniref:3-hydroxyacyl-CoA dehydrogenase NAD-binding domain-containing protein n=1 Tax=Sphingobacterium thalpophilum TaxID=259 RepID=A0ABV4H9S1_9SPHI
MMMQKKENPDPSPLFDIQRDSDGIVFIQPLIEIPSPRPGIQVTLEHFVVLMTKLLQEQETTALVYTSPLNADQGNYMSLFNQVYEGMFDSSNMYHMMLEVIKWKSFNKPIVSILDRSCTGIRLAPMLWSDYRIAIQGISLGFPESKFGAFTGLGTTVLLPQIIGYTQTLQLLTQGNSIGSTDGHKLALIDHVAADFDGGIATAKRWILSKNRATDPAFRSSSADMENTVAAIQKKTRGLLPGTNAVIQLLQSAVSRPLDEVLQAEATVYLAVLKTPEVLHMVRTLDHGIHRTQHPDWLECTSDNTIRQIGILGAGMMGSGIAYEAAKAGLNVILKDVTLLRAQQGKAYSAQICEKLLAQGNMDSEQQQALLSRITATEHIHDLSGSDLIIEAVFEDAALKAEVTKQSFAYLTKNGVFASNTTSLPISNLATATPHPERFIGMHFFSPVDRMPLVEIIRGQQTDQNTLQQAVLVALKLGKIPIVVHDGPAFFTSRIFFNYLLEAITMLLEGIPAQQIETEALTAGFAVGPLAVLDEISLELMLHVYDQLPTLHASQHRAYAYLANMIKNQRKGRKSGHGFYDYDSTTRTKTIWQDPTLSMSIDSAAPTLIRKRLLHVMALDSYRCLEEGILDQPIDGDIGSVLGVGYPAYTGGVFGHIDLTGLPLFVQECTSFFHFGEQWELPPSLKTLAGKDFKFYTGFRSNWQKREE